MRGHRIETADRRALDHAIGAPSHVGALGDGPDDRVRLCRLAVLPS